MKKYLLVILLDIGLITILTTGMIKLPHSGAAVIGHGCHHAQDIGNLQVCSEIRNFEPTYAGGNMTAPKEVVYEEEYDLFAGFSEAEIDLMAAVVYYEAGHQPMEGKQYVVDVILNRLDDKRFPDTVTEIISYPGQFSTYKKAASMQDVKIPIDCYGAVIAEIHERSNDQVLYFSSEGYNGKTHLFKCGDHYFSR